MTPRIFNVLAGIWLFVSAFAWPHDPGQLGYTVTCALATVVFAVLTSYFGWARYLTASTGVVIFVLAFALSPWGSATFWHNAVVGIAIMIAALMNGGREAARRERDFYGRIRV